jgi:FAD/FMN-containing dehydrogenase
MTYDCPIRQILSRRGFLRASTMSSAALAFGYLGAQSNALAALATSSAPGDPAALQARIDGEVLLPSSKAYDAARRVFSFNPTTDVNPALIVRCKSERDVARSLEHARSKQLEIAVRGGGHDVLGASTLDGGIVIDLGLMKTIEPDHAKGLVRVEAGVRAGQLSGTLQAAGRAVALGCNPAVGVSGLTLGGGLGWLLGKHGASCDNLIRARIITADGRFLTVSEQENSELFWAIRGGGGNFGIATSLTYRTHPVGNIVGGYIAYSGERMSDFFHFYRDLMDRAPDELTVEVLILSPSKPVIFAMACYSGDERHAEAALAPLRNFGPPLADGLSVRAYADISDPAPAVGKLFEGPPPDPAEKHDSPGIYWLGASLETLNDSAIDTIVAQLSVAPRGWAFGLGHYLHGAICRVAPSATPLLRPKGSMAYHFDSFWGDSMLAPAHMSWVQASMSAMRPHSRKATYVNYLSSDDSNEIKSAYGPHYSRLSTIKRKYDPDNIFHRNRNIKPAA